MRENLLRDNSHMVELIIPGVPLAWKAPYVGTRGAFSIRSPIKEQFRNTLRDQYQGPLLDEALSVDFIFMMPIPKSVSKKKRAKMVEGEIFPTSRPDRGNLLKLYEDVLTGVVIKDDSFIVCGQVIKIYSEIPLTVIRIETLQERIKDVKKQNCDQCGNRLL